MNRCNLEAADRTSSQSGKVLFGIMQPEVIALGIGIGTVWFAEPEKLFIKCRVLECGVP
jgi:hypothetical protein